MSITAEQGLALLCNAGGMILHVLRNDLNLADAVPGRLLLRLADSASRVKAMDFLVGIKEVGAFRNWEWSVMAEDGPTALHFSGRQMGKWLLIVGATDDELATRLYEDMLRLSQEQTDILWAAGQMQIDHTELEANIYDEFSRLNNELVTMQRELAKKNAELERLNREKNHFLGMAAHDLRSPLQAILMQSGFLLEEVLGELNPQQREFLESIRASSKFMVTLVDNLLDIAKIETGHLQLNLATVNLETLVAKNIALNRVLAAKKRTEIDLDTEPLPPTVVDAGKIEQVLNNLIGNAVKFSPPGSRVAVRLTQDDAHFRLTIHDQGPGISPEEQEALFQPFRQGRARGTDGESSTGLGLMIVKRIVTGHGGKIWLESEPGAGTTFFVSIPFHPPEESTR